MDFKHFAAEASEDPDHLILRHEVYPDGVETHSLMEELFARPEDAQEGVGSATELEAVSKGDVAGELEDQEPPTPERPDELGDVFPDEVPVGKVLENDVGVNEVERAVWEYLKVILDV